MGFSTCVVDMRSKAHLQLRKPEKPLGTSGCL